MSPYSTAPDHDKRRIRAGDPEFNAQFSYTNNHIKTSKYTLLKFLPINLIEQFQRLANFYFLCLLFLQMVPVISSLTPVTTAIPLIGVLAITAIKDAYDDFQRHRSDSQVNNRLSQVLRKNQIVNEKWHKVVVGDIIRMEDDHSVAADILLLSTSEPNGLCYIETAELDGETNLKCRQCLPETAALGQDLEKIGRFNGEIICELPNNNLNRFEGTLKWNNKEYSLDNNKVLLRGCKLRNTAWCYGMVIFAGKDTKLMQNSGKTTFKRTTIDRLLNFIILGIVFLLFSMCLFCTLACGIWEQITGQHYRVYLPWDALIPEDPGSGATVIALLVFFSYAIVLNTVVPISLYVSVEVIRLFQSFLISWDKQMYHDLSNTAAKARTTTLNEELGQVEYIFSDKTGTLTQNIMTFNKCSIAGRSYGDLIDRTTGEVLEVGENTSAVDLSWNSMHEPTFRFFDQELVDAARRGDTHVNNFFRLLALCHTVMPEEKNGCLEYQAQSPDENALVAAARNFGFVFKARTPDTITIQVHGETEVYELLCILDFNNVRKRMSVILRRNGKIRLYCKGADSVIYEHLRQGDEEMKTTTQEHLNKFAGEGLRTLCLAVRDLDEVYFEKWKQKYHEASVALENREQKLEMVFEEIEQNMEILGATAIEDKLQDGVPQTIAHLGAAGIKLWVLTGDKQDTAINIGYSCQLLSDDMADIFIVDELNSDGVERQLSEARDTIRSNSSSKESQSLTVISLRPESSMEPSTPLRNGANRNEHRKHSNGVKLSELTPSSRRSDTESRNSTPIPRKWDTDENGETNNSGYALIINGPSLLHALTPRLERLFLEVGTKCRSVICCRVTPLQKALVVSLVKKYLKAVTLSIGDGANDVSMIKTAHIGVGISGQEGLQAVLASDYSIAQFKYLERLLLVHGRWSYFRMAKFLRYFFYKNFAFTLCHFWFAFFCGFSAQTVFDPMFIAVYNLFYTSLPVLSLGFFDQDVNASNSLKYPQLYQPGLDNFLFNKLEFLKSACHGLGTSGVLFFITYGAYFNGVSPEGQMVADHMLIGSVVASILVCVVTVQMALDTAYYTVWNHITIWGSLGFYFILQFFYNYVLGGSYVGSLKQSMEEVTFWATLGLTLVILLVPVIAYRFYLVDTQPTLSDRVRLKQRLSAKSLGVAKSRDNLRTPSIRRSRRSLRSGYAFSHQEGFGRLITSGKIMRRPKTDPSNVQGATANGASYGRRFFPSEVTFAQVHNNRHSVHGMGGV